jgi:hypothetical protein
MIYAANIGEEARALHMAPRFFYYTPGTRAELARMLGAHWPGDKGKFQRMTKRRLYAIYHAWRRKELI